jgi:hypothetical protein
MQNGGEDLSVVDPGGGASGGEKVLTTEGREFLELFLPIGKYRVSD